MSWDEHNLGDAILLYGAAVRKTAPRASEVGGGLEAALGVGASERAAFRDAVGRALQGLADMGSVEIEDKHYRLTAQGEARCREVFDVTFPCRLRWSQLKSRLLARALVPEAPVSATLARMKTGFDAVQALAINQADGLTGSRTPTAIQVRDALAWRALGGDPNKKPTYLGMLALAIGRELGAPPGIPLDLLLRTYAAKSLGASSTESSVMKTAALRRWAMSEAVDEPDFVDDVMRAARHPETQRFGDHKVFLASVFDRYRVLPVVDGTALDWPAFSRAVVQAHLDGRIRLARADLVTAMDPDLVERSEVRHETATFHFIDLASSRGETQS